MAASRQLVIAFEGWVADATSLDRAFEGWATGAIALPILEYGHTYSVQVQVKDSTQQHVYSCDKRVWIHTNEPTVAAPVLTPQADVDSATPVTLRWATPVNLDNDTFTYALTLTRTTGSGSNSETYSDIDELEFSVNSLLPGTYTWYVVATDEHLMVGSAPTPDTFIVTLAGTADVPDGGSPPTYTPTRPLVAEDTVKVFSGTGAYLGEVGAKVAWTARVDGPDSVDSVVMPKSFLTQFGYHVERPELLYGWEILYCNHYYTVERFITDLETRVSYFCRSREVSELSRIFSSTSINPFFHIAKIPSYLMPLLLSGNDSLYIQNGHFAHTDVIWNGTPSHPVYTLPSLNSDFPTDWGRYTDYEPNGPFTNSQEHESWPSMSHARQDGARLHVCRQYVFIPDGRSGTWSCRSMLYPMDFYGAPPGSTFTLSVEARIEADDETAGYDSWTWWQAAVGLGCTMLLTFVWYAPDRETILGYDDYDITASLTTAYQTFTSPSVTKKSEFFRVAVSTVVPSTAYGTAGGERIYWRMDNFVIAGTGLAKNSGWTYYGQMNTRDADILHTSPGWIEFRTWTVGVSDRYSTVVGALLCRVVSGSEIVVYFNAGGAGAKANIYLDNQEIQHQLDVSAQTTYTISNMDIEREHVVKIEVAAVKVAVAKFTQDTWNRITVKWQDMSLLDCGNALWEKVGGEYQFDTVNRYWYHQLTIGDDLEVDQIINLERGKNILSLSVEQVQTKVINRLAFLGYGEGTTRLRVVVDSVSTVDGQTSQTVYGIQYGIYTDTDVDDYYLAYIAATKLVEETAWPRVSYRLTVLDSAAAYIFPGDTVRVIYDTLNEKLRVLEVTRDNEGGPATLIVGDRIGTLSESISDVELKLNKLGRV